MSKKTRRVRSAAVRCKINYQVVYAHSEGAAIELYRHRFAFLMQPSQLMEVRRGTFWNNHAQRDLAEWHALDSAGKTAQSAEQNTMLALLGVLKCS